MSDNSAPSSRLVRAEFERLGSGDRVRLLERIGIPPDEIRSLPPHQQIREVARRVVAAGTVETFRSAISQLTD